MTRIKPPAARPKKGPTATKAPPRPVRPRAAPRLKTEVQRAGAVSRANMDQFTPPKRPTSTPRSSATAKLVKPLRGIAAKPRNVGARVQQKRPGGSPAPPPTFNRSARLDTSQVQDIRKETAAKSEQMRNAGLGDGRIGRPAPRDRNHPGDDKSARAGTAKRSKVRPRRKKQS